MNIGTSAARLVMAAALLLISGCAGVEFYSDEGLTHRTGIKYYTAKPYLLVANTGAKDKPVEVSIVYIPDLSHPTYAKPVSGLGTSDLSLSFNNGMLASVGEKTDSKIPELITALGSFVSNAASAAKGFVTQGGRDYTPEGTLLVDTAKKDLDPLIAVAPKYLNPSAVTVLRGIRDDVEKAGLMIQGPSGGLSVLVAAALLENALDKFDALGVPTGPDANTFATKLDGAKSTIAGVLKSIAPEKIKPTYFLFEIDNSSGKTVLNPITGPAP